MRKVTFFGKIALVFKKIKFVDVSIDAKGHGFVA
jgi:hypothetical protein